MRELQVVLKDDFDHSQLADRTIPYTWDGINYEIDLSEDNAAEFDTFMQRYVAVSRKAKRRKKTKPSTPSTPKMVPNAVNGNGSLTSSKRRHSKQEQAGKALRDRIRAWANEVGIKQAGTGYLRAEVLDRWLLEHPEDAAALGRG